MKRIALVVLAVVVILALALSALRVAMAPTPLTGYRLLDDYNIAVQIVGSKAQWRDVAIVETDSTVTVNLREIWFHGAGFDDEIAYVSIRLHDPLGNRSVVDASSGLTIALLAPAE